MLINKKYLKALDLWCTEHKDEIHSVEEIRKVEETFEKLIPPYNLETLSIVDFFGHRYPTWVGTGHLSSLKFLTLKRCESCMCFPPLGHLSHLKFVKILGATAVTKIGPEFLGCDVGNPVFAGAVAFPMLETLILKDMPNWEEWTLAGAEGEEAIATPRIRLLPRLRHLKISQCPKLRAILQQLGLVGMSLKDIEFIDLGSLKVIENFLFLSERLVIIGCEGLELVSNIPHVGLLFAHYCQNLSCVEKLDKLQHLVYTDDMQKMASLWLPGIQQEHKRLHGDDLVVYVCKG
ncbi:hypothetical protein QOZ80_9AG0676270 [Eleusine coracana subsp. coracana]|nr:hypothetical protein QOZ80_9AG0676270 [Eleusine coracana subsp. coracana]